MADTRNTQILEAMLLLIEAIDTNVETDLEGIKTETDKIGSVGDFEEDGTLLGYFNRLYQHVHQPSKVYPTMANGVVLTGHVNAWTLGAISEVIPANTITTGFDIHYINVEAASATDVYEMVMYKGSSGAEVEIGRIRTNKNSNQSGANDVPIQIAVQDPNTRISVAIASQSGGSDTLTVSIMYHVYQ